jgi:hypothetical protein
MRLRIFLRLCVRIFWRLRFFPLGMPLPYRPDDPTPIGAAD